VRPWPRRACSIRRGLGAALVAVALLSGVPGMTPGRAFASDPIEVQIEGVAQELEASRTREQALEHEAVNLRQEIDNLRVDLIGAAAAAQARERAVAEFEDRLIVMRAEEATKIEAFRVREDELVRTLAALQILGRRPVEALIALPASLTETVRTSLVLSAVVSALERDARNIRDELGALARLRDQIERESATLAAQAGALQTERETLAVLLARKDSLYVRTEEARVAAAEQAGALAAQAQDLRDLLRQIEAQKLASAQAVPDHAHNEPEHGGEQSPAGEERVAAIEITRPEVMASIGQARGGLVFPVMGQVVVRYNQTSAAGVESRGITIESRAGALVTAPFDGVVVFVGPFRGYGQLLIIEHSEGYHSLLAGMGRIDGALGQWVLAGEPVGVMGSDLGEAYRLYVELRRDGQPVDPLPWLAAADRKVSG
jgi:septal ring factor EnvC (AmiA/AmiB activator)